MARTSRRTILTGRDVDILAALDRSPLTVEQLLKFSRTFARPFGSESRVRGRLQALLRAGWVCRWHYATTARGGTPDYYRLTLDGYRMLYGPDAEPPTKRHFSEIGVARQFHTRCLADFIVHVAVCAHASGLRLTDFWRENTLRLEIGDEALFPDCAFAIRAHSRRFNFVVELDNGTERVRSKKDADSWERKIRLYERHQDQCEERFRVLVVTTRSSDRLQHILEAAARLVRNRQRRLFYGVALSDFLREPDAVAAACFRDHRGLRTSLVPWSVFEEAENRPAAVAQRR